MNKLNETLERFLQEMDPDEQEALVVIIKALNHAKIKHPKFTKGDLMYAAAVVAEESGELSRATIQYTHEGGDWKEMVKEAAQTAATSIRMLVLLDHSFSESPELFTTNDYELCDQCDGCGWYEGGPTLRTHCTTCDGTGRVKKERTCSMCMGVGETTSGMCLNCNGTGKKTINKMPTIEDDQILIDGELKGMTVAAIVLTERFKNVVKLENYSVYESFVYELRQHLKRYPNERDFFVRLLNKKDL